jgi:hypothetical protein
LLNHFCRRKAIIMTYSECVSVALALQHASYYIVFFPHYLINDTIFGKILLNIKCVLVFLTTFFSETFLILIRIQPDVIINVRRYSCKVPVILVRF